MRCPGERRWRVYLSVGACRRWPSGILAKDDAERRRSHHRVARLGMPVDFDTMSHDLEDGAPHGFSEWPANHFAIGPSGVYTIWSRDEFLYVGMSYVHRGDTPNPQAKGVFGRLASHASGRRSGDQFCIYICDRFVIPRLGAADLAELAAGKRLLDGRTREFIREHLTYRVVVTGSGHEARALESHIRSHGLRRAGRPHINP